VIALAVALAALATLSTGAAIAFALLGRRDNRELLVAKDMIDQERAELRTVRGDLTTEVAAHAATVKKLEAEKKLRESVEVERNEAARLAREQVAEHIRNAGVADAIHLVDSIYALPLPGVVVREEVVPAGDPSRTDDDLLRPDL
jgi:hypothetical protein